MSIIPIIIGATGIVTRSLRKNLEAVPGKHSIDSLQKTAILGTSHIIWKELQCEAWSLSGGDHRWFKRSTGKKRPVTRDIHIYNNNTTTGVNNIQSFMQLTVVDYILCAALFKSKFFFLPLSPPLIHFFFVCLSVFPYTIFSDSCWLPSELTADVYNTVKMMDVVLFLHIFYFYLYRNQNYFYILNSGLLYRSLFVVLLILCVI